MAPCVIGRTGQEVLESARRIGARFGRDPEDVLKRHREHGPVGTIAEAAERLKQIEEIGYDRVMLQHLAHDDRRRSASPSQRRVGPLRCAESVDRSRTSRRPRPLG